MQRHINQLIPLEGNEVFLDTETNGLNPHEYRVWSVQVRDRNNSILLTNLWDKATLDYLRSLVESKTVVAHNLVFDLKALWRLGFRPPSVYCTMNNEKVITAGSVYEYGLADTLKRRKLALLEKATRTVFHDGTMDQLVADHYAATNPNNNAGRLSFHGSPEEVWTEEMIDYAFEDIDHLPELYDLQVAEIAAKKLEALVKIENAYLFVAAGIEWNGILFDVENAELFAADLEEKRKEAELTVTPQLEQFWLKAATEDYELKSAIWDEWLEKYSPFKGRRVSTMTPEEIEARNIVKGEKPFASKPKPPTTFNLSSPIQLKKALRGAGVYTDTTARDALMELAQEHPVITELLEFREYEKLGQLLTTVRNEVSPVTGRIHPGVNQNVSSGRQSMYSPNLQQIPSKSSEAPRFRSHFIAPKGRKLIVADYPAYELIASGSLSGDENLLHALKNEEDMHCYTMSLFLNCPASALVAVKDGKETDEQRVIVQEARESFENEFYLPDLQEQKTPKAWVKKLRDYIKTMTYGLSYGLSPFGMSKKFHCDVQAAERLTAAFFAAYPKLKTFLEGLGEYAASHFKTKPTVLGRIRYFQKAFPPNREQHIQPFLDAGFPYEEAYEHSEEEFKTAAREYRSKINRIRRQAGNFAPQGSNADATKLACAYFIKKYPQPDSDVKIVLTVHDEIILEAPDDPKVIQEAGQFLVECMERAAALCVKREGLIKVDFNYGDNWKEAK